MIGKWLKVTVLEFALAEMSGHFVTRTNASAIVTHRVEHKTTRTTVQLHARTYAFVPQCHAFAHQMTVQVILERVGAVCVVVALVTRIFSPLNI
jgi:hypothetical protein